MEDATVGLLTPRTDSGEGARESKLAFVFLFCKPNNLSIPCLSGWKRIGRAVTAWKSPYWRARPEDSFESMVHALPCLSCPPSGLRRITQGLQAQRPKGRPAWRMPMAFCLACSRHVFDTFPGPVPLHFIPPSPDGHKWNKVTPYVMTGNHQIVGLTSSFIYICKWIYETQTRQHKQDTLSKKIKSRLRQEEMVSVF